MFNSLIERRNIIFCIIAFLPFVSVLCPLGVFQESDLVFFGIWFLAGVYSIILFFMDSNGLFISRLSLGFFLLSAVSIIGVFQTGLKALGGINEIREGTATFIALGVLAAVRKRETIGNTPFWLAPFIYGILTMFGHYSWMYLGWKTYIFLDIAAFPMLASLPLYINFRKSLSDSKNVWDAAFIAGFSLLLFYCDNKAAIIACICAFVFVYFLPIGKKYINFLPRNDGFYISTGLAYIACSILICWIFFPILPPQLQSRTMLGIVTIFQHFQNFSISKFMHIIFGYGWGSYQEFPVLNIFNLENFSMYADGNLKPNWEFVQRNLLHSHNFIIETLVSSGLIGVGLILTMIYKWIQSIDSKDWSGRFFIVSYFILLSAWFQTLPVLIFSLMALILVKNDSFSIKVPRFIFLGFGLFLIIFSCAELWSSLSLNRYKPKSIATFEQDISKFIDDPAHQYDKWSTYKASNMIIGSYSGFLSGTAHIDKKYLPGLEKVVINLAKDYLDSFQKNSLVSSIHTINLFNTFASLKNVNVLANPEFFKIFKTLVAEHVHRFPERVDMSIGFLNLCFDKIENIIEVDKMSDIVLQSAPNHPVGLWFKGLAGLTRGNVKKQSLEKMQLAVKLGLCRFMPIDKQVLLSLGIQK